MAYQSGRGIVARIQIGEVEGEASHLHVCVKRMQLERLKAGCQSQLFPGFLDIYFRIILTCAWRQDHDANIAGE